MNVLLRTCAALLGSLSFAFAQGGATEAPPRVGDEVDPELAKEMLQDADRIVGEVAELRGWEWKRAVEKGVYTEKKLRGFVEKALAEEYSGGKLQRHQWLLTSMGLLPKGTDLQKTIVDVLMNQIGGFYDPERNAFFMMTKTKEFGRALNGMLIAHELTHALDDQYFGLDALMEKHGGTHDGDFAVGAVVEGSATALMYRWLPRFGGKLDLEEMQKMAESEGERSRAFFEAAPYFHTLVAKYLLGAHFLGKGKGLAAMMQSNEARAVEIAMRDVPASSEQILDPGKYWDEESHDPPVVLQDEAEFVERLVGAFGLKLAGTDVLGQIHCTLLTRKPRKVTNIQATTQLMMSPRYWANRESTGWGGDLVVLGDRGADEVKGIVWITLWDSAEDREEFVTKYRELHEEQLGFGVATHGRCAVFGYGSLAGRAEELLGFVREHARFRHGKASWSL